MCVFVIGLTGKRLMPTSERKARILLKEGKAEVFQKNPFSIRLLYKTGGATQHLLTGIDTGGQHIGISVVRDGGKVLHEEEVSLRKSMAKRSLMEARKAYRRGRRYRKVRYRHPKWRHHTVREYVPDGYKKKKTHEVRHWRKKEVCFQSPRPEGWLPPSLEQKAQFHILWIRHYLDVLPEDNSLKIEVGRFDVQHMKAPSIRGEMYQKGPLYEEENLKVYVFARDGYTCQCCHKKAGSKRKDGTRVKLVAHHIDFRSKGGVSGPEDEATLCTECNRPENHKPGKILYKWMLEHKKVDRDYRDPAFMNILRRRLFTAFPQAVFTYGNVTAVDRKKLHLEKSHANDAIAVALAGADLEKQHVTHAGHVSYVQQVRKKKRSLHEANPQKGRKEPNRKAERHCKNVKEVKGVCLFDKVRVADTGRVGWVTGFSGENSCRVQDRNGEYISLSEKYTQVPVGKVTVLQHNGNWIHGLRVPIGKGSAF